LPWFETRRWKKLLIGSQALVSLKNYKQGNTTYNSITAKLEPLYRQRYKTEVSLPPHVHGLEPILSRISNKWLKETGREERNFASSEFNWRYLRRQSLILVRDNTGAIVGFANILPDYSIVEGTADLGRFVYPDRDVMHTLLLHEILCYHRQMGKKIVNLGMVPYHGLEQPDNLSEVMIRAAYEIIKRWEQLQSLEATFAQFQPEWEEQYLVFRNSFDLIMLPAVLPGVMRRKS
jgi:phosphatidylglycerol lysyltransferase